MIYHLATAACGALQLRRQGPQVNISGQEAVDATNAATLAFLQHHLQWTPAGLASQADTAGTGAAAAGGAAAATQAAAVAAAAGTAPLDQEDLQVDIPSSTGSSNGKGVAVSGSLPSWWRGPPARQVPLRDGDEAVYQRLLGDKIMGLQVLAAKA
jgi:hypothetical protein